MTIFSVDTSYTMTDGDNYNFFTGYKQQPWPAASWSEMYRFEKGDKATGYIYNKNGSNSAKWIDETKTLNWAVAAFSPSAVVTVFALLASTMY